MTVTLAMVAVLAAVLVRVNLSKSISSLGLIFLQLRTDDHRLREDAILVRLELQACIEVEVDWAACPHFLQHVFLGHSTVSALAHVVGIFDAHDRLAPLCFELLLPPFAAFGAN